jgi:Glycerol-3-phosphate dehydrogenase
MPATIVAASTNEEYANMIQHLFMTNYFRVYTSTDIIGVELGGSLKMLLQSVQAFLMEWAWVIMQKLLSSQGV